MLYQLSYLATSGGKYPRAASPLLYHSHFPARQRTRPHDTRIHASDHSLVPRRGENREKAEERPHSNGHADPDSFADVVAVLFHRKLIELLVRHVHGPLWNSRLRLERDPRVVN